MAVIGSYSATDLVTRHIRELIASNDLAPGTKIKIDDLATELGVSRTPVRDALTRLQSEGLVEIVSRVGVYVMQISDQEVLEVYSVKASLEPIMARWATERSTPEERQAFFDSAAPLAELAKNADSGTYTELVIKRRLRLLEMARSDVLTSIFRLIDERVRILRQRNLGNPLRLVESYAEHVAIATAVRDGDADRAAELAHSHVQSARESLLSLLEPAQNQPTSDTTSS
jgi:DNA-binding GntR family transcriptional regulator